MLAAGKSMNFGVDTMDLSRVQFFLRVYAVTFSGVAKPLPGDLRFRFASLTAGYFGGVVASTLVFVHLFLNAVGVHIDADVSSAFAWASGISVMFWMLVWACRVGLDEVIDASYKMYGERTRRQALRYFQVSAGVMAASVIGILAIS